MSNSLSQPDRSRKTPETQLGSLEAPVIADAMHRGDLSLEGLRAYRNLLAARHLQQQVASNAIELSQSVNLGDLSRAQEAA